MPLPPEYQELLQRRRDAEAREARRETRRELLFTIAQLVGWVLVGMAWIGLSLHVTDEQWGWIYWWFGWLLWFGGVWFTLMRAYTRGVARGDWQ